MKLGAAPDNDETRPVTVEGASERTTCSDTRHVAAE
jgi:hypothetical protein